MKLALVLALASILGLGGSLAAADPKPPAPAPAPLSTDDCAKATAAHRRCVLDLKPEDLEGHKPVQEGIDSLAIQWSPHTSLLHIRRDFISEIVKSADDLP